MRLAGQGMSGAKQGLRSRLLPAANISLDKPKKMERSYLRPTTFRSDLSVRRRSYHIHALIHGINRFPSASKGIRVAVVGPGRAAHKP